MSKPCPLPESVPDVRVERREGHFCYDVAMIHSPSPNDRVQSMDQHRLSDTRVTLDDFPDLVEQRFDTFLRWLDQQFATVLAHVLAKKVETFGDMGDPDLLF